MNEIKVKDIYGTEVRLGFSGSGWIRFDLKNEKEFPEKDDGLGNKIPVCLAFGETEARMIRDCLELMLKEE